MENSTRLSIKTSTDINELVGALAKAQGEMKPATFNRVNPHFKNRYADFTSCMDACRLPLSKNGLAVSQMPSTTDDGKLVLVTLLAHTSGQWMAGEFPLISAKMDSQGIGSAMTYAKRYSLCGMTGIVADEDGDDDGEAAAGRERKQESAPVPARKIMAQQVSKIRILEDKLDESAKNKLYSWMGSAYKVERLEDILVENFQKILGAFENAVKYVEQQQKLEVVANV